LNDELAGFSLWYYRFSTWKGRRFYLEDLYIKEPYRGKGLGKNLINEAIEEAKRMKCTGMMWQVLDWNQPAIDFYTTLGVKMDSGWLNVHLDL
jgi:GNAT superfamily N-acetyltransferase